MSSSARRSRCFSAKVWAYRELSGKKYFDVFLGDGAKTRIDFLEGVTTQQSFVALGRALEEKMGTCSITAMNKLEGTSKNGHRSAGTPDFPTNDSVLFSVRFCAVHPKDAGGLPAASIFRGPLALFDESDGLSEEQKLR
jgi:hypothetical protein